MEKEDKELLLKDLCARLPYGVYVNYKNVENKEGIIMLNPYNIQHIYSGWWKKYKPYLRPMSSMTEEEKKEYIEYAGYEIEESVNGRHYEYYLKDFVGTQEEPIANVDAIDWLNAHHFDYRGLIPKNIALDCTGLHNT